jgi:enterochelin esterase-like enzyme
MKKNIFILLIVSLFISCNSTKNTIVSESQYYTDSIYSNYLAEYRKHNIYLPKGFDSKKNYPIIYKTDGITIDERRFYKETLDSLINNKIIHPIILVESHCNTKIADSTSTKTGDGKTVKRMFRYFEYVENQTNETVLLKRFPNHMNYFKNEMMVQIEKQFKQKIKKSNKYFYGFSNGGDFGLSLLNKHPELIGTYLCFSSVGMNSSKDWKKEINYPNLYIVYGTEEGEWVSQQNEFMKKVYSDSNSFAEIRSFEGGHDYKIWNQELIKLLTKLFSVNNK